MSEEHYFLIRKHPLGGFGVALQNPDLPILEIQTDDYFFDTVDEAADHIFGIRSDAKVRVHSECVGELQTNEEAFRQAAGVIQEANAELARLYRIIEDIDEYAGELIALENIGTRTAGKHLREIIKD